MKASRRNHRRAVRRRQSPPRAPRFESLEQRFVFDSTVVFNEIMYHPASAPGTEGDFEFVELFNQMAVNMDIGGWSLQGGIQYTFPSNTVINGRSYLVIASNPTALAGAGFSGAMGPFTDRLGNAGDEIRLVNNSGRVMNVVEYSDAGDWPVGADGSGFSLAKLDKYASSDAAKNWTTSRNLNGTPGAANFPSGPDPGPAVVFNEIASASGGGFWLEIVNQGTSSFQLGGSSIETSAGAGSAYVFPTQSLAAGEILTLSQGQLGFGGADGDKLYLYSSGKDRLLDARSVSTQLRGLAVGHGSDWLYPSAATPGAANTFNFRDEIVINEIMYHATPTYPQSPTYQTDKVLAVDASTNWRYNQKGASFGSTWAQSAHPVDGANWFSGPGLLAFEGDATALPIRTVLDDPQQTGVGDPFVVTTYFETEFTFGGSVASVDQLLLGHVIDDGAIFYLNGVEVLRYNMPAGSVTSSTLASSNLESSYIGPISIPKSSLVQGVNRLSVEVHQSVTNSTDIVFGAELFVTTVMQPSGSATFAESDEEWVELYNRSAAAVDLTGWSLADGIEYVFPAGTVIPAGGYLVVAADQAALQAKYPSISIVGDFSRSLANSSDRIVLLAPDQNPADEVQYFDGGYWPQLADGRGSSLELRDPNSDNSKAESWAASNERSEGEWNTYTLRAIAASDTGPVGIWNEFVFGMVDDGEVLIDDVSVISNPGTASATQLIQNGSFQSDALGGSPQKWRIIGNHHGTIVADPDNAANKVLDLRATGTSLHEGNNAGTTFVGNTAIVNGTAYEISFRARWVGGSPQLNARFWLNRVGETFILETPTHSGTPGAENSTYVANAGPTFSDLKHGPVVPAAGQAVTVSVKVDDPQGVSSVVLWRRVDGGSWTGNTMALGAGGLYSGTIAGQAAGTVVQFYVQAVDGQGASATFPAAGQNSRAMYEVNDGAGPTTAIDSIRIVMLGADSNNLFVSTNLMNNEEVGATVIYNGTEIFYDVGVRLKGSSFSRRDPAWLGSYAIQFRPEQLFRGVHEKISLDSTGRTSGMTDTGRHDEILVQQIMNRAGGGLASNYDDLAYMITPRSDHTGTVILELARYEDAFLDESFNNGSDGEVFEYELVYYQNQTTNGDPESLKILTGGSYVSTPPQNLGTDKDKYRWNNLIKNNRAEDDYSRIIAMNQAMSLTGSAFLNTIGSVIDVDQWLRTFAVANLAGVSDILATGGNQHNIVFYVRPDDGKVLMFPWDWDESFRLSNSSNGLVIGGSTLPLAKLLASPAYTHAYYGHLWNLTETSYRSDYLTSWATHFGGLVGQNFSVDISYVTARRDKIRTLLNSAVPATSYAITTNGGNDFQVGALSTVLSGTAWIDVKEIRLAGSSQPLPITWTSQTAWQVTVPLTYGFNPLVLQAYDFSGNPIYSDSITVESTVPDPRLHYSGGTYSQNFNGLPTAGSTTLTGRGPHDINGVLSSSGLLGWSMSNYAGSSTNTEFRAQDGSQSGSGGRGVVGYGSTGQSDRALGTLATSNQISRFGVTLVNSTGSTLTNFTLAYTGEQWRRGEVAPPNSLSFSYALGAANINSDAQFVGVSLLDFDSPNTQASPLNVALDGNSGLNRSVVTYTVAGLNWAPGQTLTLRWTGEDLSGQDDGLAIDDLSFSASASSVPGDFDGDNDVDGADFVAWQTNFPKASGATRAMGDADADGDVDGADFVVWQTNFPTSGSGGVAPQSAAAGSPATGSASASSAPPAVSNSVANFEPPLVAAKGGSTSGEFKPSTTESAGQGRGERTEPSRRASPRLEATPLRLPDLATQVEKKEFAPPAKLADRIATSEPQKLRLSIVDQVFEHDSMYRSRHFGRVASRATEQLW
jgi:hypothetical protein